MEQKEEVKHYVKPNTEGWTAKEYSDYIQKVLTEEYGSPDEEFLEMCWGYGSPENIGGLEFSPVESERDEGGGDYDGYHWCFKLDGRYFMIYGYYTSWDGSGADDVWKWDEVQPVEKTVTAWESVGDIEDKEESSW